MFRLRKCSVSLHISKRSASFFIIKITYILSKEKNILSEFEMLPHVAFSQHISDLDVAKTHQCLGISEIVEFPRCKCLAAPKGWPHSSPGQRPGNRIKHHSNPEGVV